MSRPAPAPSRVVSDAHEALSIKFNNIVYDLKRKGAQITVLSLGEAFFDIPLKPFDDLPFPDLFHYSHSRGLLELREKLCAYYRRFGVSADPEREIIVTAGSKAAIHFALMAMLDPGDEVLIGEPSWVSYPEQVKLCYGRPVMIPYDKDVRDYERYVTPRTKAIIISNPHNPRGQVLGRSDLEHVVDLARRQGAFVLVDEAYSDFVRGEEFVSGGAVDPEKGHVVVCNSISKNLGISGWRLGYVIARDSLISQILKVNQHIVTCPATVLSFYVARHFEELLETCRPQIERLIRDRQRVAGIMDGLGLSYLPGSSTFYFFVSIAPSRLGSEEFCLRLLHDEHISAVPGIGYGASCDAFIRVSVGTEPLPKIEWALGRIRAFIDQTR
jgi:aminotransferase